MQGEGRLHGVAASEPVGRTEGTEWHRAEHKPRQGDRRGTEQAAFRNGWSQGLGLGDKAKATRSSHSALPSTVQDKDA